MGYQVNNITLLPLKNIPRHPFSGGRGQGGPNRIKCYQLIIGDQRKSKTGGITLLDFKQCYKAVVIKIIWYWHYKQTNRPVEQNGEPRNTPECIWSINISKVS